MTETLKEASVRLEHFETPVWAAEAILKKEIFNRVVIDPCVGIGILADAAREYGCVVVASDIHDWGYPCHLHDWLQESVDDYDGEIPFTVFMNPPFSLATQFVEKAFELGAQKIVCFQRFAWWESQSRRAFWEKYPPNRVYICGDRAHCWRHDIPKNERGSSSPTAHAWFVWERGVPAGTILGHIWKEGQ